MKVLDIGCGWGGMAIEIAKQTGAYVKGITLSENQLATASKRAQEEGLSEKVTFKLQDYRDEKENYDRIVSVGMFEHVGVKYFRTFFSKTYDILNDKGVFLLHTIAILVDFCTVDRYFQLSLRELIFILWCGTILTRGYSRCDGS